MKKISLSLILVLVFATISLGKDIKSKADINFKNSEMHIYYPDNDGIRLSSIDIGVKKKWGNLVAVSTIQDKPEVYSEKWTFDNSNYVTQVFVAMPREFGAYSKLEIVRILQIQKNE